MFITSMMNTAGENVEYDVPYTALTYTL